MTKTAMELISSQWRPSYVFSALESQVSACFWRILGLFHFLFASFYLFHSWSVARKKGPESLLPHFCFFSISCPVCDPFLPVSKQPFLQYLQKRNERATSPPSVAHFHNNEVCVRRNLPQIYFTSQPMPKPHRATCITYTASKKLFPRRNQRNSNSKLLMLWRRKFVSLVLPNGAISSSADSPFGTCTLFPHTCLNPMSKQICFYGQALYHQWFHFCAYGVSRVCILGLWPVFGVLAMCNISGRSFSLLSRAFHFVGARVVTQMSDITLLANNINTVNRLRNML